MKIVFVNQPMDVLLPPHQNSIGLWTCRAAPHMSADHSVIALGKRSGVQPGPATIDGVDYDFMPPIVPNRRLIRVIDTISHSARSGALPGYASRLAHLDYAVQAALYGRRHEADWLHVHNFSQFVPTIRSIAPKSRIALHMNCEWLTQLDPEVMARRMDETDVVFGCSDHITRLIQNKFPSRANRVQTVFNGVDPDVFSPRADPDGEGDNSTIRLLFVGRVSPEKGVHDLVEAFRVLSERNPDLRFELDLVGPVVSLPYEFIVGVSDDDRVKALSRFYEDGREYGSQLEAMIPDDLRARVHFRGQVSQHELVAYYHRCDVLVNPSYSESFGMSVVEAMACERPVLCARTGGMVDIVQDGVGLLHEAGDVDELVAAAQRLVDDANGRREMGRTGRRRVLDKFAWHSVAASVLDAYAAVS